MASSHLPPGAARAIVLLASAAFASQAMVRVVDPLLPQIAADIGTTVGAASVVTSAYAVSHGLIQAVAAPLGDRVRKYAMVAWLCAVSAVAVAACGFSNSLATLAFARLACGLAAGTIIPLGMAFIADVVPYARRQPVLGRYLAGQILGLVSGQIIGGVLGDHLGWRSVFFFLSGLFVLAGLALAGEMLRNPLTRAASPDRPGSSALVSDYAAVFGRPWPRVILLVIFCEGAVMFGAFAYIGADLHARLGLSFSAVGAVLATFGAGGLAYVLSVRILVERLGEIGLVTGGGALLALAFLALAVAPAWWVALVAVALIGLAFHMVHNTLQINATQMAPEARATALGIFASAFYLGQSAGVAAAAPVIDRMGAPPIFIAAATIWPLLTIWFARRLRRR